MFTARDAMFTVITHSFHNFEHASHVTMSVVKLLSRIIVAPDLGRVGGEDRASALHDHTYGITSDPTHAPSL